MKSQVIVPTYGQESFTVRCFDSILDHTDDYRLIWVDNGSTKDSRNSVLESFVRHKNRIPIWPGNNLGFVGGTNLALRAVFQVFPSDFEYIVLLNNDTQVTADWLRNMIDVMERHPSMGAVGPLTSCDGSWQGWKNVLGHWGEKIPQTVSNGDTEEIACFLRKRYGDALIKVEMIAFFCAVFRRKVFEDIGYLDPLFGTGLGDDDDYCHRMLKAGYEIGFAPGVYVVHHHRTTFAANCSASEIEKMQWENVAMYRRKHGIREPRA